MIIKIVALFLVAMLVLGMFGKLRVPRLPRRRPPNRVADARKCPKCGGYILGEGPCACSRKT